jgi:hypothetical protein
MGMPGAYTGPGTDEASQYIRTIHPALAERVSRFEENVAADGLQLSPEQPDRLNNLPAAAGNHHNEAQARLLER